MKMHPRQLTTNKAKSDLFNFLRKIRKKYNLTDLELIKLIREIEQSYTDNFIIQQLRFERHGTFDKPAGIE